MYNVCICMYVDIIIQLYSEKCTGCYFKVWDDDLSSKHGSLCTLKMKNYSKIFIYTYIYFHIFIFFIKLKHNMNISLCEFDG